MVFPAFCAAERGSTCCIEFGESGIKSDGYDIKFDGRGFLQLMEQFDEDETVFSARESAEDSVTVGNHAVLDDRFSGRFAQLFEIQ